MLQIGALLSSLATSALPLGEAGSCKLVLEMQWHFCVGFWVGEKWGKKPGQRQFIQGWRWEKPFFFSLRIGIHEETFIVFL